MIKDSCVKFEEEDYDNESIAILPETATMPSETKIKKPKPYPMEKIPDVNYQDLNVPEELRMEEESLNRKLNNKYNSAFLSMLKKIAYEISIVGLTEQEACLLVDYDYGKFLSLKESDPLISQMFEKKNVEYKRSLLKPLSEKAKTDDKLAQWLLQNKFVDFNKRKPKESEDFLGAAISWIQKNDSGLVSETSGKAFLVKKINNDSSVNNILN